MNKKILSICSMLLASSLGLGAFSFKVKMPIEFVINGDNPNNLQASVISAKSDLRPGCKWVMLPQVAAMFDPENPNEPVVLLDVRKTMLKIIAQNPELANSAGISSGDFKIAGISDRDMQVLQREAIRPEEISFLAQLAVNFIDGDTGDGLSYMRDGGLDVLKGGANVGFGMAILLKKATVVVAKFCKDFFNEVTESEREARSIIE